MTLTNNTNNNPIGVRTFSGYDLKIIALATMLIDHIGAVVLWRYMQATGQMSGWIMTEYQLIRYIGRMAFPIYCFLLVEGFLHTRSVGKYALRLGIFALISEIPFDLALSGNIWNKGSSNVFFTLLIGLLLIWGISFVEKFYEFWKEKQLDAFIGGLAAVAVAGLMILPAIFVADVVLGCDYGMAGVLAILVLYLFRRNWYLAFTLAVMVLFVFSSSSEILALIMLYPISLYDGTRGGNGGKMGKWLFYAFYPAHLLILALICMVLNI